MFDPNFRITPAITKDLMEIEAARQAVIELPIDVEMLRSLRETAMLLTTHHSTRIEGNRLTQAQVAEALSGARFPGRERDEAEVRNYYRALEKVEHLALQSDPIRETDIQCLHGFAFEGRATPTPYRDGQNVIRDAASGRIVYMPPESADVPDLMTDLVAWINDKLQSDAADNALPVPLVAALAHYQYATIHPYYDGNGRTARLLTTMIHHKCGYGLKGIYSLEEYYSRDLASYYEALAVGDSHNYYMGHVEADVTGFVAYFCRGMAEAFTAVRTQAVAASERGSKDQSPLLRKLDPRQRQVLGLFRSQGTATTAQIASPPRPKPEDGVGPVSPVGPRGVSGPA